MIAKIGRSNNLFGVLSYNNTKIQQEKGEILLTNKMIETLNGQYSVPQLMKSFEPYLIANQKTEKHTLHISLNPDPGDNVSDQKYKEIAEQYMREMGYGEQPFVVFKHTDIDRSHIHIVSVCVDENGKKISDQFEKVRSMKICRELEKEFGLQPAIEKQSQQNEKIFRAVNYKKGDVKSQISSVIRHLPEYYQFQTLGEYNALLSLYNITTEQIEGELHGKLKRGLLYFPLSDDGKKIGHPLKASLFGKTAGLESLQLHFEKCKLNLKNNPAKQNLKSLILKTFQSTNNESDFKRQLAQHHIDTVIRRNEKGRIYGVTFIDHHSKTVWNGSRLGKELTANNFNDCWNRNIKPEVKVPGVSNTKLSTSDPADMEENWIEALGGLLPQLQGEDYEEQCFVNEMMKKRKRQRS
ncbi:relaxase/mobilization nuclease domain-containing protein [Elizabethkingia anophelis]|uniref:conjugal transfer protein MobB n=1 Tax=Elizabethkingia anophelis TaxID=1117645 RepID=UPI0020B758A8|nr:conjugal transfer protein MobB [Elizabethkingia anophelis]UTG62109.1 relaxase/mobilization nuclease domain-containing protein [Elizabethkingia anophelis]UXM68377.1 relaxase/mobilization nuclease domain-containing protein [Elizabethkingia anophelis]